MGVFINEVNIMAYCKTEHQITRSGSSPSWTELKLAVHRKHCQMCRLVGILEEKGGIPFSIINKLSLPITTKPGNAWIGTQTHPVTYYQGQPLPIIDE